MAAKRPSSRTNGSGTNGSHMRGSSLSPKGVPGNQEQTQQSVTPSGDQSRGDQSRGISARDRIRRSRTSDDTRMRDEPATPEPVRDNPMQDDPTQDGQAIAERFMQRMRGKGRSFADSIGSSDEVWGAMEQITQALPAGETIRFLATIYTNLEAERRRQFDAANADGEHSPGSYTMFPLHNHEAHQLLLRTMIVHTLLDACGGVPDYTLGELLLRLRDMDVVRARRMARAIHGFFPCYGLERWIDIYGSRERAEGSKFAAWSSFEWDQLEAWIENLEREYHKRLTEETEAGAPDGGRSGTDTSGSVGGTGTNMRAKRTRSIPVASTDLDVIRIIEAMRQGGIIGSDTTGPQIVGAFWWKGELNGKPENYYAARKNLVNPPSDRILAFIACLLETAGDDVKQEVITLCKRR